MRKLTGHIAVKRLQGKLFAVPGAIGGGGGGGGGPAAVIAPLTVTKNGTYNKAHSTATFSWDEATEYDFTIEVEGIPLRVKKADTLAVPASPYLLALPEYAITSTMPDGTQQTAPLNELGLFSLDDNNSAYMTDELMYGLVWIREAAVVNALVGAAVFENNTVYVTDFAWVIGAAAAGLRLSVTAAGPLVDGYMPVTVNVSGGPLPANIPEVDSLEVTDDSPTAVKYNGEIYLLVEE